MKDEIEMRTKDSLPVFRNMGTAFDPPEATTPSRAKRIFRTHYCKHTGVTKRVIRAVYVTHGKGTESDTVRTSLLERTPARPLSVGFHTLEEKREEAAERDAVWRALSFADQLKALDKRPGESKKQRGRIAAAMSKAAEAAKNPVKPGAPKGGVNKKHTADEKTARVVAHTQAVVANHPTTRRRNDTK